MSKFYITTAIDYANAAPHIGHVLEKVQADALARYHRAKGDEVLFVTGTDEHGTKIARAAEQAGEEEQAFVDKNAAKFKSLRETLDLSWDKFVRTSDRERHWPVAQKIWEKLVAKGDIYKKSYKGFYCVGHEAFVTERDLENGICRDHQKPPEAIEEENYFFRLSQYADRIKAAVESDEIKILPESRKNEIVSFIEREGLSDVSFSRPKAKLSWGIPVPGDELQVMYVWADALTNYISAIGYGEDMQKFGKWWPADAHVIGKDILRFHAAIWPGMLMAVGISLPKSLLVHGFITMEGDKMAKSVGNVVDPVALVQKYGTDPVRYYLLKEIPSGGDGDWSDEKFRALYTSDLSNGIGNFAARVLALAEGKVVFGERQLTEEVDERIRSAKKKVDERMEEFRLHDALAEISLLAKFGDEYVNRKAPWKMEEGSEKHQVLWDLVVLLDNIASLLAPFLPGTSKKISSCIVWEGEMLSAHRGEILFPRLA